MDTRSRKRHPSSGSRGRTLRSGKRTALTGNVHQPKKVNKDVGDSIFEKRRKSPKKRPAKRTCHRRDERQGCFTGSYQEGNDDGNSDSDYEDDDDDDEVNHSCDELESRKRPSRECQQNTRKRPLREFKRKSAGKRPFRYVIRKTCATQTDDDQTNLNGSALVGPPQGKTTLETPTDQTTSVPSKTPTEDANSGKKKLENKGTSSTVVGSLVGEGACLDMREAKKNVSCVSHRLNREENQDETAEKDASYSKIGRGIESKEGSLTFAENHGESNKTNGKDAATKVRPSSEIIDNHGSDSVVDGITSSLHSIKRSGATTPAKGGDEVEEPELRTRGKERNTPESTEEVAEDIPGNGDAASHPECYVTVVEDGKVSTKYFSNGICCQKCDKVCDTVHQFNAHMRSHEEKKYKCPECNQLFRRPRSVDVHMRCHTNSKPYVCELCEASFRHDSSLSIHMRNHRKEKNHKCPKCNKGFVSMSCAKKHMRRRCFKGKIACDQCGLELTNKPSLKAHMLAKHKSEEDRERSSLKTFECHLCKRLYQTRDNMYRHQAKEHDVLRPWGCTLCTDKFPDEDTTVEHVVHNHHESRENASKFAVDRFKEEEKKKARKEEYEKRKNFLVNAGVFSEEEAAKTLGITFTADKTEGQEAVITIVNDNKGGITVDGPENITSLQLDKFLDILKPKVIRKNVPSDAPLVDKVMAKYPVLMPRPVIRPGSSMSSAKGTTSFSTDAVPRIISDRRCTASRGLSQLSVDSAHSNAEAPSNPGEWSTNVDWIGLNDQGKSISVHGASLREDAAQGFKEYSYKDSTQQPAVSAATLSAAASSGTPVSPGFTLSVPPPNKEEDLLKTCDDSTKLCSAVAAAPAGWPPTTTTAQHATTTPPATTTTQPTTTTPPTTTTTPTTSTAQPATTTQPATSTPPSVSTRPVTASSLTSQSVQPSEGGKGGMVLKLIVTANGECQVHPPVVTEEQLTEAIDAINRLKTAKRPKTANADKEEAPSRKRVSKREVKQRNEWQKRGLLVKQRLEWQKRGLLVRLLPKPSAERPARSSPSVSDWISSGVAAYGKIESAATTAVAAATAAAQNTNLGSTCSPEQGSAATGQEMPEGQDQQLNETGSPLQVTLKSNLNVAEGNADPVDLGRPKPSGTEPLLPVTVNPPADAAKADAFDSGFTSTKKRRGRPKGSLHLYTKRVTKIKRNTPVTRTISQKDLENVLAKYPTLKPKPVLSRLPHDLYNMAPYTGGAHPSSGNGDPAYHLHQHFTSDIPTRIKCDDNAGPVLAYNQASPSSAMPVPTSQASTHGARSLQGSKIPPSKGELSNVNTGPVAVGEDNPKRALPQSTETHRCTVMKGSVDASHVTKAPPNVAKEKEWVDQESRPKSGKDPLLHAAVRRPYDFVRHLAPEEVEAADTRADTRKEDTFSLQNTHKKPQKVIPITFSLQNTHKKPQKVIPIVHAIESTYMPLLGRYSSTDTRRVIITASSRSQDKCEQRGKSTPSDSKPSASGKAIGPHLTENKTIPGNHSSHGEESAIPTKSQPQGFSRDIGGGVAKQSPETLSTIEIMRKRLSERINRSSSESAASLNQKPKPKPGEMLETIRKRLSERLIKSTVRAMSTLSSPVTELAAILKSKPKSVDVALKVPPASKPPVSKIKDDVSVLISSLRDTCSVGETKTQPVHVVTSGKQIIKHVFGAEPVCEVPTASTADKPAHKVSTTSTADKPARGVLTTSTADKPARELCISPRRITRRRKDRQRIVSAGYKPISEMRPLLPKPEGVEFINEMGPPEKKNIRLDSLVPKIVNVCSLRSTPLEGSIPIHDSSTTEAPQPVDALSSIGHQLLAHVYGKSGMPSAHNGSARQEEGPVEEGTECTSDAERSLELSVNTSMPREPVHYSQAENSASGDDASHGMPPGQPHVTCESIVQASEASSVPNSYANSENSQQDYDYSFAESNDNSAEQPMAMDKTELTSESTSQEQQGGGLTPELGDYMKQNFRPLLPKMPTPMMSAPLTRYLRWPVDAGTTAYNATSADAAITEQPSDATRGHSEVSSPQNDPQMALNYSQMSPNAMYPPPTRPQNWETQRYLTDSHSQYIATSARPFSHPGYTSPSATSTSADTREMRRDVPPYYPGTFRYTHEENINSQSYTSSSPHSYPARYHGTNSSHMEYHQPTQTRAHYPGRSEPYSHPAVPHREGYNVGGFTNEYQTYHHPDAYPVYRPRVASAQLYDAPYGCYPSSAGVIPGRNAFVQRHVGHNNTAQSSDNIHTRGYRRRSSAYCKVNHQNTDNSVRYSCATPAATPARSSEGACSTAQEEDKMLIKQEAGDEDRSACLSLRSILVKVEAGLNNSRGSCQMDSSRYSHNNETLLGIKQERDDSYN